MNLRFLFSFIAFLYCFSVNAQFANNWYFGANAGLNFNTVPPTPPSVGTTSNVDNSSAISDVNGNLLFYTDGMKVWNSNNLVMPNGICT